MAEGVALSVHVNANLDELRTKMADADNIVQTTTSAMKSMANAYDGAKTIANANAAMLQVQALGGSTKLTESEQTRLNATLNAGLEKYAALGKEAPAGMQALADETKHVDNASGGLMDTVKSLAVGFAAMFTARAAFNFVKSTVEEASALQDLSNQTHTSVEDIQVMAGAMSEFGVDSETLAKGMYRLSRGIAGGDESVAAGLHLMGLSMKDVEGLNGKELFLKIEDGLATLQGGLRDTASADLFGGKLGEAMAGASEGIRGATEKWEKFNHVASAESVAAMDTFGESIVRANKNLSSIAANMIGPVAQGFNVVYDASERAGKLATFWAMMKDGVGSSGPLSAWIAGTNNLATLLDHANVKAAENTKQTQANVEAHHAVTAAVDKRTQAEKFMAALEADAAAALTTAQIANLEHLKEIGALNAKNAAGIGVNAAQFELYKTSLEAAADALRILRDVESEEDAATTQYYAARVKRLADLNKVATQGYAEQIAAIHQLDAAQQVEAVNAGHALHSEQERAKVRADAAKNHIELMNQETAIQQKQAQLVNAAVLAEFDAQVKLNASWGLDAAGAIHLQKSALDVLTDKLTELHLKKAEGISQAKEEQVIADEYTKKLYDEAVAQDALNISMAKIPPATGAADTAVKTFTGTLVLGIKTLDEFNAAVTEFYAEIAARGPIGDMSGPSGAGSFAGPSGVFGFASMPTGAGHRAGGGSVSAGSPYIVGERGPELFVPRSSGSIVPNGGGGSSTVINLYVTQPLGTPDAIGQAIVSRLTTLGGRLPWQS